MKCPYCGYHDTKVVDSRPLDEGFTIRRRRECSNCLKRCTTYERVEGIPHQVIKKDGRRKTFDRNKILNGLIKATEKRPISIDSLEKIVDEIEKELYSFMKKEVATSYIGEMIMEKLKELDEIAYVRFASVYRQFKDINTFMEEMTKLIKTSK